MQPLPREKAARKSQALAGVMVAGDEQDGDSEAGELRQHAIEQLHGGAGGRAAVVDVPGDDHGVRADGARQLQKAFRPIRLIAVFQQGNAVDRFSEMQIGQMQKSHGNTPLHGMGIL